MFLMKKNTKHIHFQHNELEGMICNTNKNRDIIFEDTITSERHISINGVNNTLVQKF